MGGSAAHGKRPPLVPLRHRRVHFLTVDAGREEGQQQEVEAAASPAIRQQLQSQPRAATSNSNATGAPSPSSRASPFSRASPSAKLQRQKSGGISAPAAPTNPGDRPYFKIILFASFFLTINAGFINLITLHSAKAMPSVHVTGMVARLSKFAATWDLVPFYEYAVAYLSFVAGTCTAGVIVAQETFYLGRSYGRALFLIAAVEAAALLTENSYPDTIFFIWLCAYSAGLQNGLTSKFSGNAVRTTHLTGASTDLGIALGHIMKGRQGEWWKVKLHGIAVVGFFIGGIAGYFGYEYYGHAALLFNVSITTALAIAHTLYIAYHERLSPISVLESATDIVMHKRRVASNLDLSRHSSVNPSPSPSASSLAGLTPASRAKRLAAARASPSMSMLSPASMARRLKRHFPKNENEPGEDADDHKALLKDQEPASSKGRSSSSSNINHRTGREVEEGRVLETRTTTVAPIDGLMDVSALAQLPRAPSVRWTETTAEEAAERESVASSSHLSHRSLQYLEEEGLVPKPEDEEPLPEYAPDDFAALEAEAAMNGELNDDESDGDDEEGYASEGLERTLGHEGGGGAARTLWRQNTF